MHWSTSSLLPTSTPKGNFTGICAVKCNARNAAPRHRRCQLSGPTSIENCPVIVPQHARLVDLELGPIIGKSHCQALASLIERKFLTVLAKVECKTDDQVATAITRLLRPYAKKVLILTADKGKKFASHQEIAECLEADFYFTHPYAFFEQGTNKSMNGLVRQHRP